MSRINLWLCPSNIVEVCYSPVLWAMLTAPAPVTQQVYVVINQFVTCCSQTPFKCSITGLMTDPEQFVQIAWTRKLTLKEATLLLAANKDRLSEIMCLPRSHEVVLTSVLLCLEFLLRLSQVICGVIAPHLIWNSPLYVGIPLVNKESALCLLQCRIEQGRVPSR